MKYPISLGDRENSFVNIHALKNLINQKIDELVDAAPETLNTLKELADAIEQNGLDDLATKEQLETALNTKADEEDLLDYVKKSDMSTMDANGHDYIEIGGIKWATMNIGANSVTDYGLYFQWGDTQGYTASQCGSGEGQKYFGWANYKYSNDDGSVMTKYNEIDGKTVLEAVDDAAVANWGGSWRMPTTEELRALGAAVNTVWTTDYQGSGVAGMICTDKTDSSKVLFFPAAGDCYNSRVDEVGYYSNCWSSSLVVSLYANGKSAYYMRFGSFGAIWDNTSQRFIGRAVRGVLDGGDKYATKAEVAQLQSNIVQSDWNQSDSTAIDYIKNKPEVALKSDLYTTAIDANGHDYVEIAGIKWATMNVGANSVTDTGLYFQWGDTQGYTANQVGTSKTFNWTSYKYATNIIGINATMTKYNESDEKIILDVDDDAAVANWGGTWRMPTIAEFQALSATTTSVWTADYEGSGISGFVFTSIADNSKKIFFPATGSADNNSVSSVGSNGHYWSSSRDNTPSRAGNAKQFYFTSSTVNLDLSGSRFYGFSIRPVLVEQTVSKYATNSDLSALISRVETLEAYHTT